MGQGRETGSDHPIDTVELVRASARSEVGNLIAMLGLKDEDKALCPVPGPRTTSRLHTNLENRGLGTAIAAPFELYELVERHR